MNSVRDLPFAVREQIAKDETSAEEELLVLACDRSSYIRLAVSKNSSSSPKVLALFSQEREQHIISHLLSRENLPTITLNELTKYVMESVKSRLDAGENEDDVLLEAYICYKGLIHSDINQQLILEASKSGVEMLRMGAVSNKNTSSHILFNMIRKEKSLAVVDKILSHANSYKAVNRFLDTMNVDYENLPQIYRNTLVKTFLPEIN